MQVIATKQGTLHSRPQTLHCPVFGRQEQLMKTNATFDGYKFFTGPKLGKDTVHSSV